MGIEFGKNLKIVRRALHISQVELAESLSVSQSVVSQWEKGEISPTVDNLIKICEVLNVSSDLLLGIERDGE